MVLFLVWFVHVLPKARLGIGALCFKAFLVIINLNSNRSVRRALVINAFSLSFISLRDGYLTGVGLSIELESFE